MGPALPRWCVLLLVTAVMAACTSAEPDAAQTEPPEQRAAIGAPEETPTPDRVETVGGWVLDALDPGGRVLQVTALWGGCEDHHGLDVEEGPDAVTLTNRLSEPAPIKDGMMQACPSILVSERVVVVLDEALGDRPLEGCGGPDCLDLRNHEAGGFFGGAAIVDEHGIVVDDWERIVVLDLEGELQWRWDMEHDLIPQQPVPSTVTPDLVLREVAGREVRALERADGTVRWGAWFQQRRLGGEPELHVVEVDGEELLVGPRPGPRFETDPAYTRTVGPVALADGTDRWRWEPEEGRLVAVLHHDDLVVAITSVGDLDVPSGTPPGSVASTVLTALALTDGTIAWSTAFDGGSRAATVVQGVVVVQVWGGRYGVDPATGAELWRDVPAGNARLTPHEGEVIAVDEHGGGIWRIDPTSGAVVPAPVAPPYATPIAGDLVVEVDDAGVATATDVRTGEQRWSTPLLARAGTPGIGEGMLVFPTPIGALALDPDDGSLLWSWADEALEGPRGWG